MRRTIAPLIIALAACFATACSNDRACYPGDYRRCSCDAGGEGYQQCDADGSEYGVCNCSGNIAGLTTGSGTGAAAGSGGMGAMGGTGGAMGGAMGAMGGTGGGTGGTAGSGGGGKLPFMSTCMVNEDCDTGLCYNFPSKGLYCTKACMQDAECPPPSPGCNPKMICKAP